MTDNAQTSQTLELPVLALTDEVILPGMVSPILLDHEAQAAVDAARTSSDNRLLLAPRVGGSYAAVAVLGVIEQVGRTPGGESAVVVRGVQRVRIGAGVTGPGAALWVQATTVESRPADRPHHAAGRRLQVAGRVDPAAAGRLAGRRQRAAGQRPVLARATWRAMRRT